MIYSGGVDVALESRPKRISIPTFQLTNTIQVKVIRKIGEWVKGRWVTTDIPHEFLIKVNLQPLKYQEIIQMPEADRTKEWIKVFTTDLLVTAEESDTTGNEADIIEWEGNHYKVMSQKHWVMGVLNHKCAYAAKVPRSAL